MFSNPVSASSGIFKALKIIILLPVVTLAQSTKSQHSFGQADIQASNSADQWVSVGILPDGNVRAHNTTLRTLIAAAYNVDVDRVTGGPDWLDSDRFDIYAKTAHTSSQADRLQMMQTLLAERFKLVIHHDKKITQIYTLTVGKSGPKFQAAKDSDKGCSIVDGVPGQIHIGCHSYSTKDLAEFLPQAAGGYLSFPVTDLTGLNGTYDFQLDWMNRRAYDVAKAKSDAGGPKDPLAVSIFEAVEKLGLSLEKRDDPKDVIFVESVDRVPTKSTASGAAAASPASELKPDQVKSIDSYVTEEMGREHTPGLAIGVYSRGQILLAKGYGLANVELNVPVKPETIFQSGSVGKQFASAAVMMLVEEGKIGLDDSIVKYFPNAPDSWKPILVKNLLSHTSGLAEYESPDRTGPKGPFYLRLDYSEDQLVEKIEALPIEFKPGEKWNYRNTNYVLLGVMIHKVTGEFYADYLQERIFKPWYMNTTRLISDADIIPNRSSGYEMRGGVLRNQDWVSPTFNSTADGTLYFNVLDLAKWDEALYGTSLLKQSSLDRIWTVYPLNDGNPNPADYGFGWGISAVNGHKLTRVTGKVLLDGVDIYAPEVDPVAVRRQVGMVFQKSNPFPKSVFENVAYGLRVTGIGDRRDLAERVERALRQAALWDEVKDRLDESGMGLSGGQQQRLCIARALAVEPEVLLMDEPASALDPIATAKLEDLIADLKHSFTIVIVTHNMQQAGRVSQRTAFFYLGRLIEVDDTTTMFTRPKARETEDYITGRFG